MFQLETLRTTRRSHKGGCTLKENSLCFHSTVCKQSCAEFRLQNPLISFMQSRIHRLITKPSIRGTDFL